MFLEMPWYNFFFFTVSSHELIFNKLNFLEQFKVHIEAEQKVYNPCPSHTTSPTVNISELITIISLSLTYHYHPKLAIYNNNTLYDLNHFKIY